MCVTFPVPTGLSSFMSKFISLKKILIFRKSSQSFSFTALQYSSHIWINLKYVFLISVWNMFLKRYSQTPEPSCVLWSYHYADWQGSHCRPCQGAAYFSTFHLNFWKHVSIFSKTLILFHRLNHKEFYSKTGTMDFNFSINPRNLVFSINA